MGAVGAVTRGRGRGRGGQAMRLNRQENGMRLRTYRSSMTPRGEG